MSGQLIAEYSATEHLVLYSEGRISIWRRRAAEAKAEELRPAKRPRPRIIVREDDAELPRARAAMLRAKYAAQREPTVEQAREARLARSIRAWRLSL